MTNCLYKYRVVPDPKLKISFKVNPNPTMISSIESQTDPNTKKISSAERQPDTNSHVRRT